MQHPVAISLERPVAVRPAQAFAVISDIESYPQFVPGFVAARILERASTSVLTENQVALGPLRRQFLTQATLDPPHAVHVRGEVAPAGRFTIDWKVSPQGPARTRVSFALHMSLNTAAAALAARALSGPLVERILAAFIRRMLARPDTDQRRR